MEIMDYINKQDWDGAIAECTKVIDEYAKDHAHSLYGAYAYMNRGYVRCFVPSKDDNYKEAIEDLSMAITLAPDEQKVEYHVKRAYAYWISRRYDNAIADCKEAIKLVDTSSADIAIKVYILAGKADEIAMMAHSIADTKDQAEVGKLETEANSLETESQVAAKALKEATEALKEAAKALKEAAEALKTATEKVNIAAEALKTATEKVNIAAKALKAATEHKAQEAATRLQEAATRLQEAATRLQEAAAEARAIVAARYTPHSAFAHELLGNIYSAIDHPLEALEEYGKALAANPFNPGSSSLLDKYREVHEKINQRR